jgi:hypothetical protein
MGRVLVIFLGRWPNYSNQLDTIIHLFTSAHGARPSEVNQYGMLLVVVKYIYLLPTFLYFFQDIEGRCLLLTSSMSFVDLPFQKHRMMEKHHMYQNPYIS